MKKTKAVFIILAVILVLSGCANGKKITIICLDYPTFDEAMESATHIVDAVYSGEGDNGKYVFEVVDTLKGEVPEAGITVYDIDSSHVYSKGVCYLLFLIKTISVFHYEHPKYESIGSSLITENDADWKEKHETVEAAKDSFADSVKEYGSPFIVTDSLKEVLDFAPNIFVVTVESIFAKSPESPPTTDYVCKVKECLKGKVEETLIINGAARIVITLFNGTVRLNHDYVVLLGASKSGTVYVPASPKLNVFDISHYDAIKARLS